MANQNWPRGPASEMTIINSQICCTPQEKKQYLLQIELCLQKDFSVIDCPADVLSSHGACWDTEPIYFMASPYLNA